MKGLNFKELSTPELTQKLADERSSLVKLKLNHAVSPIENPMKIRSTRKAIAQLITELTARTAAEQQAAK